MIVRNATEADIHGVVSVHKKAFSGFFLTRLGTPFLAALYRAFAFQPGGILLILCDKDGQVLGFAGGALDPVIFFRQLKRKQGLSFLVRSFPGLIRNPFLVMKKLWYALFYKGEKPKALTEAALLSSIAVDPGVAGKSLGKRLLADFENVVRSNGVGALFLTTDRQSNDNVVSFYLRSGYKVESEFVQAGGRIMLRFIKKLDGVRDEQ